MRKGCRHLTRGTEPAGMRERELQFLGAGVGAPALRDFHYQISRAALDAVFERRVQPPKLHFCVLLLS